MKINNENNTSIVLAICALLAGYFLMKFLFYAAIRGLIM